MSDLLQKLKEHEIWVASNPEPWAKLLQGKGPHQDYQTRGGFFHYNIERVEYPYELVQECVLAFYRALPFHHLQPDEVEQLAKQAFSDAVRGNMRGQGQRATFGKEDLSGQRFQGNLPGIQFSGTKLNKANATGSVLAGWTLEGCSVDNLTLSNTESPSILSFDLQNMETLKRHIHPQALADIQRLELPIAGKTADAFPFRIPYPILYEKVLDSYRGWLFDTLRQNRSDLETGHSYEWINSLVISGCEGENVQIAGTEIPGALIENSDLPGLILDDTRLTSWSLINRVNAPRSSWKNSQHVVTICSSLNADDGNFQGVIWNEGGFSDGSSLKRADFTPSGPDAPSKLIALKIDNTDVTDAQFNRSIWLGVESNKVQGLSTANFEGTLIANATSFDFDSAQGMELSIAHVSDDGYLVGSFGKAVAHSFRNGEPGFQEFAESPTWNVRPDTPYVEAPPIPGVIFYDRNRQEIKNGVKYEDGPVRYEQPTGWGFRLFGQQPSI